MKKQWILFVLGLMTLSCVSTKSTIKNVDDNAPTPQLNKVKNAFVLTLYSKDALYGYNEEYPINVFYLNSANPELNEQRFLNALAGPKGEVISYKKIDKCCPFPTKRNEMGAGSLNIYELTWPGQKEPVKLYLNGFEKGALMVPVGLSLQKE
ncbi:2-dehydro-3-deoxyphosphooctonate aldolase [Flavobacterium sp. CYK-55]|uniref:2-dehydro-3-deoxyphosphooctonate aldolase n=1 Tax=Flavobacterium sp. CYK-55 TaxID=2835529 RepID=UPI001BCC65C8|nr:2-dehydro-3-deoxyphosphooctonate aldolase [Flavobacterium sp. CYK-55]MBS7788149.1 2-dehydro-3-deoxyphosphooctonate aldolase [Flavobacterium sp. CYK-55]